MENWSIYSDQELIEAVKNGRQDAFTMLVERHRQMVARTVKGMLGDVMEADDVGQEVFVRFYNSIRDFRGDSKVGTYLTRIAINLSLNEIKKNKRKRSFFGFTKEEDMPQLPDPSNHDGKWELNDILDKAIAALEPGFRQVVVLRLVQGYSVKETANILGTAEGTVLSRLSRAQKKLREILTPYV